LEIQAVHRLRRFTTYWSFKHGCTSEVARALERAPNFFLAEVSAQYGGGGGRILLGHNTGGRCGHAAADHVAVCWILDLNWTVFCPRAFDHMYAQFRLGPSGM